jgi:rhodanese-related sulfurtransferase
MNAEELLAEARSGLERLEPDEARKAVEQGALLIDIRSDSQRERDGVASQARFVQRNVLEWLLDPAGDWRDPELARADAHVVLMCQDGYQSSLAAANLQKLGIGRATDVVGGFRAWRDAGLPVEPPRTAPPRS